MNKEIKIKSKVFFNENATRFYNFPIKNNIHISIWLANNNFSSFSEITVVNPIEISSWIEIEILIISNESNSDNLVGKEFFLGVFPNAIANGTIIEIM
jgi:hypothetical protein